MSNTNFSVLLSVYKNEKPEYMVASLESLFNQTHVPNEVILVEDGPLTDELYDIIGSYKKRYPNIFKSLPLTKNIGLGLALNEGLKVSKNNLVARMDTDDIAKPNRFEKQIKMFESDSTLSIVGSNVDEFEDNIDEVLSKRIVPENHEDILRFARRRNPFNHPSVMYKKSDVLSLGGYRDFRRSQDYDLFVRLLNSGFKGYNIQESLLYFRANIANLGRRKSWTKTKNDIHLRYLFFKKGYSSIIDLTVTTIGFLAVYLLPDSFFKYINNKYLRTNDSN